MPRWKRVVIAAIATAALALGGLALYQSKADAHGGGLNSCGCHFNRRTG